MGMSWIVETNARQPLTEASIIQGGASSQERRNEISTKNARRFLRAVRFVVATLTCCVFLGTDLTAQDFDAVERKLEEAIAAGDLTPQQASLMLQALKRSADGTLSKKRNADGTPGEKRNADGTLGKKRNADGTLGNKRKADGTLRVKRKADGTLSKNRDLEAKKRRYQGFVKEIEAAVAAGDLSEEDAKEKLIAVRREMFRNPAAKQEKRAPESGDGRKRRYAAFEKKIDAALEAGEITEKEAEKKLLAVRKELFEDTKQKKQTRGDAGGDGRKRRYFELSNKIEAAVAAGELSEEEAEEKLIAARKAMFGDPGGKKKSREGQGEEGRKRRYAEFAKKIAAAVKAGELSEEEAEKKLLAVGKKTFGDRAKKEQPRREKRGLSVEEYRRGEKQIRQLVKEGKVSPEDAEKRLIEMRKAIRQEKPAEKKERRDISVEEYRRAEVEIRQAVKAGKISKEDARKRLGEMRKLVRREKAEEDSER